ncbi:MAG TPA: potassium channel protein [Nitrospinae bacterium]|nr:potassium channel protein [Nitrospinota bacterium]
MFTAVLLMLGVGAVFYVMAGVAENMIEGRVRQIFGRRKRVREIQKLSGHHVVCGYGRIGFVICREFQREDRPFVVIDNNPDKAARLPDENIPVVVGDATSDEVLIEAGVERAAGLISSMPTDAENVFIALSARRLNKDLFIVARAARDSAIPKLHDAGADRVISPYTMGGLRMADSVLRPKLAKFFKTISGYTTKDWDFEETKVTENSALANQATQVSQIGQKTSVYILAIARNGAITFNPGADYIVELGDTLYAMGRPEQIASLRDQFLKEKESGSPP